MTMPDERQIRIAEAISADGLRPRAQRIGLIPAMLSVVQPEIDELRAENDGLHRQLDDARSELYQLRILVARHNLDQKETQS